MTRAVLDNFSRAIQAMLAQGATPQEITALVIRHTERKSQ